ncbi:acetyltransferase [Schizothecium vesticola]|uniref:Acetyltransferase n=1 Tax=Schizothecium vesticola TaxID=314040 RepID=A0AA40EVL4_9PEZI|nr:acetyltransferase [Schizothecium vesticola]
MPTTTESQKHSQVRVKTTQPKRPFPPNSTRSPITTERLLLRPFVPEDVNALHLLRIQPEVMKWTAQGRPDATLAETQAKLDPFLPPNDAATFNFAICLRATGELIGIGGNHQVNPELGWPELGYMLMEEHWGKGYATEFVAAWLGAWEGLEREEVEVGVDARTVVKQGEGEGTAREMVLAVTTEDNPKSQKILRKCGFKRFMVWEVPGSREGEGMVALPTFRYFVGGGK